MTSLRVLHTSDLHGDTSELFSFDGDFDVWVDSGDFFPNCGRSYATDFKIDRQKEMQYQQAWVEKVDLLSHFDRWLAGRPAVIVPGNHDFLCLSSLCCEVGIRAHLVTTAGFDLFGYRWSGFREVPWMIGEWPGELREFAHLVELAFLADPHILVTHAPPAGVLDRPGALGIPELTRALLDGEHKISAHFFGHGHDDGGSAVTLRQTICCNGARSLMLVDVPAPLDGELSKKAAPQQCTE